MESKQIDEAMRRRLPVTYDGRLYDRIKEYVLSYDDNGRRFLSVGVLEGRVLYRVPASKVELAEEEK